MNELTDGQILGKYTRFKRIVTAADMKDEVSKNIMNACKILLDSYPVENANDAATPIDVQEMKSLVANLLPPLHKIFNKEFLEKPSFPIMTLKNIADFYNISVIDGDWIAAANVADDIFQDHILRALAWICYVSETSAEITAQCMNTYKGFQKMKEECLSESIKSISSRAVTSPADGTKPNESEEDATKHKPEDEKNQQFLQQTI